MRKYMFVALALAALAAAATAVPAFTASSGTVTVSVTAEAPAAPCLSLNTSTLDFGTLPFSTPTFDSGGARFFDLTNCGSADQQVVATGTDATGPGGTWQLIRRPPNNFQCTAGANKYSAAVSYVNNNQFVIYTELTNLPATLASDVGAVHLFPPSSSTHMGIGPVMPCQGSNGAGETKTFTATLMAVVP
jgi:hypothetical protein